MPRHLRPTAPIATEALLPGDPKLAMELATALITKPVMSNLSRGLWGYHGRGRDGRELTIQSTGIGGPSAAVVVTELAEAGVRRAIRLGAASALDPGLKPGATLVVEAALPGDGVGAALAHGAAVPGDPALTSSLLATSGVDRARLVASTDLYYDHDPARRRAWREAGAAAVDLSAAAVLAVGRRAGVAVGCALIVAESAAGERLTHEELERALIELGARAASAFADAGQPSADAALS